MSDHRETADAETNREGGTATESPPAGPRDAESCVPPPPRFGKLATAEEQKASVAVRPAPSVDVRTEDRKPLKADIVATCALLLAGLIGCSFAIVSVNGLGQYIQSEYALHSLGVYTPPAILGTIAIAITVSHIALLVLALAISTRLMTRRRVAFYVPLTAGIIAATIFWTVLISFIASDQVLFTTITQSGQ